MAEVVEFVQSVVTRWYTLVTGGLFVLGQALQWFFPGIKSWLDKEWPIRTRRPFEILALSALPMAASFDAYHRQRLRISALEKRLTIVSERAEKLERDLVEAKKEEERIRNGRVVVKKVPTPTVVDGPLTKGDLPPFSATAFRIRGSPNIRINIGPMRPVTPDPRNPPPAWKVKVSSGNLRFAPLRLDRPEQDQGALLLSESTEFKDVCAWCTVSLIVPPKETEKILNGAKLRLVYTAANGQFFNQDLPVLPIELE